jgi:thymidine phosphorylase
MAMRRALEKIVDLHRAGCSTVARKIRRHRKKMDAELIGCASVFPGAGKKKAGGVIDFAVGISGIRKVGEHVDLDEPLLFVHARSQKSIDAVQPLVEKAAQIG